MQRTGVVRLTSLLAVSRATSCCMISVSGLVLVATVTYLCKGWETTQGKRERVGWEQHKPLPYVCVGWEQHKPLLYVCVGWEQHKPLPYTFICPPYHLAIPYLSLPPPPTYPSCWHSPALVPPGRGHSCCC